MTPGYKARRETRHLAEKWARREMAGTLLGTIDRTNHLPALTFVGLKSRPQSSGGRKNRSGYAQEHAAANLDNAEFDAAKVEEVGKER